jgi:hypothetical protein
MPSFKGVLAPEQITAIYTYIKGRAEKRIPAGRPSLRAETQVIMLLRQQRGAESDRGTPR